MNISKCIRQLQAIMDTFGDIEITGGHMVADGKLRRIVVTDTDGREIYPRNPNGLDLSKAVVDGVLLES